MKKPPFNVLNKKDELESDLSDSYEFVLTTNIKCIPNKLPVKKKK